MTKGIRHSDCVFKGISTYDQAARARGIRDGTIRIIGKDMARNDKITKPTNNIIQHGNVVVQLLAFEENILVS